MRRPSAEWLLAPVFLLPVALAAGALAWVRGDVLARLDTYGRDGAATALRWLDEQPEARAAHIREVDASLGLVAMACTLPGRPPLPRFRRGDVSGTVIGASWIGVPSGGRAEWILGTTPLDGLAPAGLSDAATRLAVESGTPISRSPAATPVATTFAALAAEPAIERLRAADLPAAAKLYLLDRTADASDRDRETARLLRDADAAITDAGGRLGPGVHRRGDAMIVASGSAPNLVVLQERVDRSRTLPAPRAFRFKWQILPDSETPVLTDDTGLAHLVFESDGTPPDRVLWTGPLDPPLAGRWSIVLPHGRAWWRSTQAQRWVLPLAFACLAFLAVPTALLLAIRRRRRLDEARARFVTEIAHDLRTPVAALRLHADLLASGRVPEADRRKHEDVVGREAARLSSLLANLLDLSRLERGTRPFERTLVDVADVVRDAVREFGSIHPLRAADVSVECPADLAALADRPALARILANLLDNAGKFTEPGTAIRVRAEAIGERGVRLVVEDDGPGIAPAERARIFEPYERGAAAATTAAPGTGLGLALVRDLARGMGGTVALRRTRSGASFEVALPGGTDD